MKAFRLILVLSCALFAPGSRAATPDTPAGKVFAKWLEAFNSGDRAEFQQFLEKFWPNRLSRLDQEMDFRNSTGGFEVVRVESPAATTLTGIVKGRSDGHQARVDCEVEPQEPHRIVRLGLRIIRENEGPASARVSEREAITALKSELEKTAAEGTFSGSILVTRHGKPIFSGAYAMADQQKGKTNALATQHRIGSMNKMFTATAVLQLVQAGKLKLSDTIGKYLTDYPNKDVASKVTIHHLLTHTGGTGDIFGPEFERRRLETKELKDYVTLYGERGLKFEPGARQAYSNYGFLLLGVIIEKISGQSYYDYVRDHIFKPAGMNSTDSLPEDQTGPNLSVGYTRKRGSDESKPNTSGLPYRGTSAGGGYSTVEDLVRFADALLRHKLLDAEHTKLLTTDKVDGYAYGFEDSRKDGAHWVGHGGGAPGMNGRLRIGIESGYIIAVLANQDPPAADRIAKFISERLPVSSDRKTQ